MYLDFVAAITLYQVLISQGRTLNLQMDHLYASDRLADFESNLMDSEMQDHAKMVAGQTPLLMILNKEDQTMLGWEPKQLVFTH